jgi:hypothetical protein
MARNPRTKKNKKKRAAAANLSGQTAASEAGEAVKASPAAAPLGSGRVVRTKVKKPSAKEQAALAKKEARAKWAERMTAEGR